MSLTALTVVTAASELPITLGEAKQHLRITNSAEDEYIQSLIAAATDWAQTFMRRILVDTNCHYKFDRFPSSGEQFYVGSSDIAYYVLRRNVYTRNVSINSRDRAIFLPGGFINAVNEIAYTDELDAPQTLTGPTSAAPGTDYQEDLTDDEWAFVYPAREDTWPSTLAGAVNPITVDFQAGWAAAGDIPESIRYAIRFKMADMFTIRDTADAGGKSGLLQAAENLLNPYVVTLI